MSRRLRAALVAFALAFAAVGMVRASTGWTPYCLTLTRYSWEWYFNGCFYGEPDPPPGSNEG